MPFRGFTFYSSKYNFQFTYRSLVFYTPELVRPLPKLKEKKQVKRGRQKKRSPAFLTDTLVKQLLLEETRKKTSKKDKQNPKKTGKQLFLQESI